MLYLVHGGKMVKIIIYLLIFINGIIFSKDQGVINTLISKEINIFRNDYKVVKEDEETPKEEIVLATYHGNITGYGPDCKGCSGITASGYNVKNNIYYQDKEYGKIRIVAADKSLPFGSIIKITDLKNKDDILAIVLDRGGAIGFKKKVYFDLLYKSEKDTNAFGKQKATFKLLRKGFS